MTDTYIKPVITRHRKRRVWDRDDTNVKDTKQAKTATQVLPDLGLFGSKDGDEMGLRRVYVGSLNYMITQELIQELFKPFGVITRVEMPRELNSQSKGYCFVEFAREQDALECMACMNGFAISGRPMKVGVPSGIVMPSLDYASIASKPEVQTKFDEVVAKSQDLGVFTSRDNALSGHNTLTTSGKQGDPDCIVYVAAINYDLTAEDVKSLFEPFGEVINVNMIPNPDTNKHKGYGFVHFSNKDSAAVAISQMNGFVVAGRPIIVSTANRGTAQPIQQQPALLPVIMGTAAPAAPVPVPMAVPESNFVLLKNIINAQAFAEEDQAEFKAEMVEEMQRYGNVVNLFCQVNDVEVDIFIEYETVAAAVACKNAMAGRVFDGRKVIATFAASGDINK